MKFDYIKTSILGCESIYRLSHIAGMTAEPVFVEGEKVMTWKYVSPEETGTEKIGSLRNELHNTLVLDLGWWRRRKDPVILMGPEGAIILDRRVIPA